MNYGVVLFHTNSAALRAEKVLLRAGLVVKLIPTPRQFSSDCGIALRCEEQDTARVQQLLDDAHVEYARIEQM